ncbi:MAG: hypothetical protein JEZ04_09130 [Spirochaetales bacterium]|nr:hypothetical protein [Spirochaetales bacterium]
MFENIIGQQRVVEEIEKAVTGKALPGSLLFSGDHYSGKISTALELSRILTCSGDKSWNCACRSCENQRLLLHPYIQILGSSFFMEDINACADIIKAKQPVYARYMFIRAVRKLLKRFDPVLWEGNEPKFKQVAANAVKAEELLREIKIDGDLEPTVKLAKLVDRIVNECGKIADSYNSDNIPIDQIRRIHSWARTSSESCKIVIFENADLMGDSSRNSLLKILEEPPENCYFILTTSRKGAIIPTILSRVRVYNFKSRTDTEADEVIRKIFREDRTGYRSIREYFLGRKSDIIALKQLASDFTDSVVEMETGKNLGIIGNFKDVFSQKRLFTLFVEECVAIMRVRLKEGRLDAHRAMELNELFRKAMLRREQYNQSSQLVLESLFYSAAGK